MAAASAIGFINMIGNLGGGVSTTIVGIVTERNNGNFGPALLLLAPFPLISASIILLVGFLRRQTLAAQKG